MKTGHSFLLMLTTAAVLWLPRSSSAAAEVKPLSVGGKIRWVHGYEEGQRIARETGKPMFVVFRCER